MLLWAGAACSPQPTQDVGGGIETGVAATVQAMSTPTAAPERRATREGEAGTPEPRRSPTAPPTVPPTAIPTRPPTLITALENTNCRSGPGVSYAFEGILLAGESAQVVARSTLPDYWYIENPDQPGAYCWLWGGAASISGDVSFAPVYTPAPSPTPSLGFDLYLHSLQSCGSVTRLVLIVQNTGGHAFMTARMQAVDLDTKQDLLKPVFERHPFAPGPADCPPGHGNFLPPGAGAFLYLGINSIPSGDQAMATITLCTEDYLGGDCITNQIFFKVP